MSIHSAWKAQIALLITKEVTIPAKYSDFADIFLKKSAEMLSKCTGINKHPIKLKEVKYLPYRLIYSLDPVKLKTMKSYIKTNLANGFIQLLKSPAGVPILFVYKPDGNLRLYIDYWGLKNLTIKNRYPFLLIGESLDWLKQAKYFTQLDFISAYYWMRIKKSNE